MQPQLIFRTGRDYEVFIGPYLPDVSVSAGATTDLANTYVMDPGYVRGDILLAGPPSSDPNGYCLQGLRRASDVDPDGDGIPADVGLSNNSLVWAEGINTPGPGATRTALLAIVRVDFHGDYNPLTGNFEGPGPYEYEQVLAGPLGESSIWQPGELVTGFYIPDPSDPLLRHDVGTLIRNPGIGMRDIVPGQTLDIPLHYCFGASTSGSAPPRGPSFRPV
jgi:hypothetical protein